MGCVEFHDFDPVGDDATISGEWRIDGQPPNQESCELLGAESVRVTFLDELRPVPHPGLFFDCPAIQPDREVAGTFDTRQSEGGTGAVVAGGDSDEHPTATWRIRIDAIDGSGEVVAFGPVEQFNVTRDVETHIALSEAIFYSGVLSAFFEIGGESPTLDLCEEAGIAEVRLTIAGGGVVVGDAREPCATGAVGTRVEPGFTYTVQLQTLDSSGGPIASTSAEDFLVAAGQRCVLGAGCDTDETPAIDLTAL